MLGLLIHFNLEAKIKTAQRALDVVYDHKQVAEKTLSITLHKPFKKDSDSRREQTPDET